MKRATKVYVPRLAENGVCYLEVIDDPETVRSMTTPSRPTGEVVQRMARAILNWDDGDE